MPTYDYACNRCAHRLEVVHGVHAHGPSACERCGGPMRKLLSPPAIHFRGSGWAKKDAREAARRRSGTSPAGKGEAAGEASGPDAASTGPGDGGAAGRSAPDAAGGEH